MRLPLSVALMSAALVAIGAGCAPEAAPVEQGMPVPGTQTPEMEAVDAGAAGGTQLEGTPPVNDTPDAPINVGEPTSSAPGAVPPAQAAEAKEFTVIGSSFAFDIKEMRVKQGDTVRVTFRNDEGFHDWVLDEFAGARTKQMQAGSEETVTFVADKAGTYEYYCSVGKHRAMGMVGKLIVE